MDFDIRPAVLADAEKITEFNVEMALESENLRLAPGVVRRGVEKSISDPSKGRYYLAHRGDEIIGQIRVTLEWSDWNNGDYWWIQNVYVVPSARRRGVYRALHGHVGNLAAQAGARGLQLYVDARNEGAQAAYESLNMARSHYLIYEQREDSPAARAAAPSRSPEASGPRGSV